MPNEKNKNMPADASEILNIKKATPTKTSLKIAIISFVVGVVIFVFAYIDMRQKTGLGTYNQPFLMSELVRICLGD